MQISMCDNWPLFLAGMPNLIVMKFRREVGEKRFQGRLENLLMDIFGYPRGIYFLKVVSKELDGTHHIIIEKNPPDNWIYSK